MPVDPTGMFDAVMTGLSKVPSAVIAAALIAGPTLIWIIARFLNPPDPASSANQALEELLWVCPSCRSINEDRIANCYRCQRSRYRQAAPVVNDSTATETASGVGVAVGPGLPLAAPDTTWIEREVASASEAVGNGFEPVNHSIAEEAAEAPAPLGFEPVLLEPSIKTSRPSTPEPPKRRARKTQGGGEATPKPTRSRKRVKDA